VKIWFPDRIINRRTGGNTTYTVALARGLAEKGLEVGTIPAASHPVATMLLETRFGRGRHPGVLHYSADTGPLLSTRTPSVVTVHGVASRWADVARSGLQERTWRTRVGAAIRSTDRIVTVSSSSARDISEVFGVSRERIRVIPHGIDFSAFNTPCDLSPELAARLPERFALYLGNIEPRKNLVALSGAFEPARAPHGLPLVVAGKPAWNYEDSVAALEGNPNAHLLGYVSDSDRVALMQRAEVFVFPSLYEGFGFPVLEALAAGAPVVTSRRGSLAEVAGPSWTTDDLSPEGLSEAVARALEDHEWMDGVRSAGPEWAARFSWPESISKHLEVYRTLVGLA
jgi:glycosyltransferase involved in cell wall biosynthesis